MFRVFRAYGLGVLGCFVCFRVFKCLGLMVRVIRCLLWGFRGWLWGSILGSGQKRPEM